MNEHPKSFLTGMITFAVASVLFLLITTGLDMSYPGSIWYGGTPLVFTFHTGAPLILKALFSGTAIALSVVVRIVFACIVGAAAGFGAYLMGALVGFFLSAKKPAVHPVTNLTAMPISTPSAMAPTGLTK